MLCMNWASGMTCSTPVLRAASRWASTRASPVSMRTSLAGRGPSWKPSIQGAGVLSPAAGGVSAEQFYRAVNKAQPSLIRTEADELTYCLHVMVRYEIEKQLIGGTLEAKDVPAVWAKLYKEYLGIEVPNDRDGCLQDSHWSGARSATSRLTRWAVPTALRCSAGWSRTWTSGVQRPGATSHPSRRGCGKRSTSTAG